MRARLEPLALLAIGGVLAFAGCGDDDEGPEGAQPVPAAGGQTPPGPTGEGYDVTAGQWQKLEAEERFEAAQEFVADNPDECTSGEGTAAADPVRDYADASAGTDYPLNAPVGELLAEGCAAALQSGEDDLAE